MARTLQLFLEMTMGCGAAKVLLTLDTVQYLLQVSVRVVSVCAVYATRG